MEILTPVMKTSASESSPVKEEDKPAEMAFLMYFGLDPFGNLSTQRMIGSQVKLPRESKQSVEMRWNALT